MLDAMGAAIRYILVGFAAAAVAMFAEPFFSEVLALVGVDTSEWAGPFVTFLSSLIAQEWFRLLAAGTIGAAAGAWMHWAAIRYDRKQTSTDASASKIPPPTSEMRLRTQEDFALWEAACLFARCPASKEHQGESLAWMYRLKTYLVDHPDDDIVGKGGPFGHIEFRELHSRIERIENMSNNYRIHRDSLRKAAKEFGITIDGIMKDDKLQS